MYVETGPVAVPVSRAHGATAPTVRAAKESLILEGLHNERRAAPVVSLLIERSWRRSIGHGAVSEPTQFRFINEFDPESPLHRSAGVVMDRWMENVSGMRVALFLTDTAGQIVARRISDTSDERTFDRADAVEGFDFSEVSIGTNALGTSIEERRPIYVRGTEHFNNLLEPLACAGVPIRHPVTGRIVGSMAFASRAASASPLMLSMVREAGSQIEGRLREVSGAKEVSIAMSYLRHRSSLGQVVILNEKTIMADVAGLSRWTGESHAVIWEHLRQLDWSEPSHDLDISALGIKAVAHRVDASAGGSVYALVVADAPRRGRPAPKTTRRSVAVNPIRDEFGDALIARLDSLRAAHSTITVCGPGGSGKYHVIRSWLARQQNNVAPVTLDVAEFGAGASMWFQTAMDALKGNESVIIRHVEDLRRAEFSRLKRLDAIAQQSCAARNGASSGCGPFLLLTLDTRSAASEVSELVAQISTSLEIPPLSATKDRIPHLVRSILGETEPRSAITFDSAALQALLRWPWPGNIAELRLAVASLARTHRGGAVQLADLPLNLQFGDGHRTMSPIAQMERGAIIAALLQARGNRSEAASSLGIGRTTLYRKLRSFGIDA